MPELHQHVACTVCGCVCDDLSVRVDNDRIIEVERACSLAEPWYLEHIDELRPVAEIDGRAVELDEALSRAVDILSEAVSPAIYGLSRSTTEGQREAVALAEHLGGVIDTTAATGHAPSLMALQQVGESTCTLGEVRNRADLVLYWASDPLTTHPRHLERYAVEPTGLFIPNGRADRRLVVVDSSRTSTAAQADDFLEIPAAKQWEALWMLRGLVKGVPVTCDEAWFPALVELAKRMKSCRFGIVFFGAELTKHPQGHRQVEALLQLTSELNAYTRFYARRMRRFGDVAGADSVLTWQTGYPFGVNFSLGYPRYNPGEFTVPDMLGRGEIDAILFVGSETSENFSSAALDQVKRIPSIVLDNPGVRSPFTPTVRFTTAIYGIHRTGTAYRMDELPIPLKALLPTRYASDGEILRALLERLTTKANRLR